MSENNMNETFEEEFIDPSVITVPIDDTLSNSGEAADAKAVGDALALKADAASIINIKVNGEGADNQGNILIDATEVPMIEGGETSVSDAVGDLDDAVTALTADAVSKTNDIVDALTSTDATKVLSAKQGKILSDRVTNGGSFMNLALSSDATGTTATINTYDSRKFSSFRYLIFNMYTSSVDKSRIRSSVTIPSYMWVSGKSVDVFAPHGASYEYLGIIHFGYVSDTSFSVVAQGSGSLTGYEIVGYGLIT